MKVFTCKDHSYFWPVGVASVIVAPSEDMASDVLKAALKSHGLDPNKAFTLQELDISVPGVVILCDGEY